MSRKYRLEGYIRCPAFLAMMIWHDRKLIYTVSKLTINVVRKVKNC